MKVIIAGSRDFADYEALKAMCDTILSNQKEVEIVSGRCPKGVLTFTTKEGTKVYGADGLGERYAKEKGYRVMPFPGNWTKYGKRAGPLRNEEMAKYADALIAFWDGESPGTRSMIEFAEKYKKKKRVVPI